MSAADEFRRMHEDATRRDADKIIDMVHGRAMDSRGHATSPDGTVRVTVDPTGALLTLDLGHAHRALADRIVETVRTAVRRAREEADGLYAPLVDLGLVARSPVPPAPAAPAAPARPPLPDEEPPPTYLRGADW
ncbi:YbaB/EbfC family nucleoid-associated protein [Saccharothrix sp. NPDC042600]|uniref:YbaB/EbfC family nucleoid-associated protein n=1 Tax=Saccharothrix TaxID=2071 RepID=UPI0033C69254|nr:hypothetical protein GCM10017745_38300 [Saccharothrix mutabilis subsp. capreolus]